MPPPQLRLPFLLRPRHPLQRFQARNGRQRLRHCTQLLKRANYGRRTPTKNELRLSLFNSPFAPPPAHERPRIPPSLHTAFTANPPSGAKYLLDAPLHFSHASSSQAPTCTPQPASAAPVHATTTKTAAPLDHAWSHSRATPASPAASTTASPVGHLALVATEPPASHAGRVLIFSFTGNHQVFPREKCTSNLQHASIAELKDKFKFYPPLASRQNREAQPS